MTLIKSSGTLREILKDIELPDYAYEKAADRYKSLGKWFDRPDSKIRQFNPHIFPQGSFRLGTAIRPLNNEGEYDLDLACKFRTGITKGTHSQKELKEILRIELEAYRLAKGIQNKLEEKKRCWRLEYQDELSFHMDIVPCIPEREIVRKSLMESMVRNQIDKLIASEVAEKTVSITDKEKGSYPIISDDWEISNPQGYAIWFENRMKQGTLLEVIAKAQVDKLPTFRYNNPLQHAIKLLKRHRDILFYKKSDSDFAPISIIITTLAAKAYQGETNVTDALFGILNRMEQYVNQRKPFVPNPVNPDEDFADKWNDDVRYVQTFSKWLTHARADFIRLSMQNDVRVLKEQIRNKLHANISEENLRKALGLSAATSIGIRKEPDIITRENTGKPWCK